MDPGNTHGAVEGCCPRTTVVFKQWTAVYSMLQARFSFVNRRSARRNELDGPTLCLTAVQQQLLRYHISINTSIITTPTRARNEEAFLCCEVLSVVMLSRFTVVLPSSF